MRISKTVLLGATAILSLAGAALCQSTKISDGAYTVERTPLMGTVGSFFQSDDGAHCAYWLIKGGKNIIVIDGSAGAPYDALLNPGVKFSPGGKHSIYMARKNGKDGSCVAVIDGKEQPGDFRAFNHITFSPDGEHVAFTAAAAANAPKSYVVLDGKAQHDYDQILSAQDIQLSFGSNFGTTGTGRAIATYCLFFSPDSKHLCYGAKSGQKSVLVCDGNEIGSYDNLNPGELAFRPKLEGKRFVYEAVVDKSANREEIAISPAGNHIVRLSKTSSQFAVVVDDTPGPSYDKVTGIKFDADGGRLAYSAKKGEKWLAVVDRQVGAPYDEVRDNSFLFSPEGRHFAYKARIEDKWTVVLDGREGEKFDGLGPMAFSPDGKHFAYKAAVGQKFVEVFDGQAGEEWDGILAPAFSSDSKNWAYVAINENQFTTIIDGHRSRDYYKIILPGSLKGLPDGSWAFVGENAESYCTVRYIPRR